MLLQHKLKDDARSVESDIQEIQTALRHAGSQYAVAKEAEQAAVTNLRGVTDLHASMEKARARLEKANQADSS